MKNGKTNKEYWDLAQKLVDQLDRAGRELAATSVLSRAKKKAAVTVGGAEGKTIFQLKITLQRIEPEIWRRVLVPDCSLARLHDIIQTVMGWEFEHPYEFNVEGEHIGESEDMEDASRVKLSHVPPEGKRKYRFKYIYDFGDWWEHEILVEKQLAPEAGQKYPVCIEGEWSGPPEDVGGPYGYMQFVDALEKPESERDAELLEIFGDFDPKAFDLEDVNRRLRRFQKKR
jgi:hypothetical protein